ncbi:sulfate/molybdate ABC transporter ATP-binding protein [Clostridium sp. 1001271B_151109_B4]|uniref:sulfate/molybdate ABC transporter ATP-binding protein n=1 Tax=Clostridium sp. 1001271B_151109_B4 TaxID=2787148 RepID=UPI0018A89A3B|nr:sulfate/molybdate ABC transporter ATP-binding protein [Clostridium sp. 1001271B_151109_B4]
MSLHINITKNLSSFNLDVSMESKGGIIGFLGASGSGKSMTLKCIAGLEKADTGKIIINDKVLFDSQQKINIKTKDRRVGFLFQNYALFPHMTIKDNIEIGLDKISKEEKNKLSSNFIKKFGLEGLEKRYPWQLSGGQQQRVALARALITSPDVLLLDEPFSALDNHLRATMERELVEILKDYNGTVVFVTHDIAEAYRVCDKIIVFDGGKAKSIRKKNELFETPKSLAEAKLTGCKNVSKAKILEDNFILAEDWNLKLKCSSDEKYIDYIAIRSHNIKLFKEQENDENVFEMSIENIVENPFDYTLYIRRINASKSNLIHFTISKEEMVFNINEKIKVKFEPEYLFTFKSE